MSIRSPRHLGGKPTNAFRLEGSSGTGSVSMYLYAIRDRALWGAEIGWLDQPPQDPSHHRAWCADTVADSRTVSADAQRYCARGSGRRREFRHPCLAWARPESACRGRPRWNTCQQTSTGSGDSREYPDSHPEAAFANKFSRSERSVSRLREGAVG